MIAKVVIHRAIPIADFEVDRTLSKAILSVPRAKSFFLSFETLAPWRKFWKSVTGWYVMASLSMFRSSKIGSFDTNHKAFYISIFPRWNLIWFEWIYSFFKTGRKMKTRDKLSYLIEMVWRGERLAERILRVNWHGMRMGSWRIRGRHSPRRMSKRLLGDIPGFLFTGRWKLSETFRSGRVWFNFLPDASHPRDLLPSCCVLASISSENRFDRKICSRYYWTRRE